jgi:hypothetical protein
VQTAWWALRPMSLLAVKEVFTGGGRAATPACPHATRAAQPAR